MIGHLNGKKLIFSNPDDEHAANKRSGMERRQEECEGFTYVSTVGWICRREKRRRRIHGKGKTINHDN